MLYDDKTDRFTESDYDISRLTADEVKLSDTLYEYMRTVEKFNLPWMLVNKKPDNVSCASFRIAAWRAAARRLDEDRVGYIPANGWYQEGTCEQLLRRAVRYGKASRAKGDRAIKHAELSAEKAKDPNIKYRAEQTALNLANRMVETDSMKRRVSKPRPPGI